MSLSRLLFPPSPEPGFYRHFKGATYLVLFEAVVVLEVSMPRAELCTELFTAAAEDSGEVLRVVQVEGRLSTYVVYPRCQTQSTDDRRATRWIEGEMCAIYQNKHGQRFARRARSWHAPTADNRPRFERLKPQEF